MQSKKSYKYLIFKLLILFILISYSHTLKAQIFPGEQNPPGVKWHQISTQNFQIVYPAEFETEAQRVSNTLEHIITRVSHSLGTRPKKITVILQNQGIISNGFVQLAPRRSEFFTTPPQAFDTQDWINSLAVHELRHVVQFDKLTGGLKAPFFEELALAIFGISLPPWFFEGDAVGIETALTDAGRGRLPSWDLIFRTNTLSTPSYSYSKNYLGSYRDLTPSYYQLGYFMTGKLRRDYGKGILDSIMKRMSGNLLRPYNLSSSLHHFTGMYSRAWHDATVKEAAELWRTKLNTVSTKNETMLILRKSKAPVDYLLPVSGEPGETLILRKGFDRTARVVSIDTAGNEQTLLKIGFQTEPNFSYSSDRFAWDEIRYDARFQKRSFNVINTYDRTSKTYRQLTHRTRLFSPTLSPDGKRIAAVRVGTNNTVALVELDFHTGKELRSFDSPGNLILQTPSYHSDGRRIIAVTVGKDGAALIEFDNSTESRLLTPFQHQQLSRPVYAGERVLFSAHYNGINNIYVREADSTISQLSSSKFAAVNPSYDTLRDEVIFNNFELKGYNISRIPLDSIKRTPGSGNAFIDYAAPLTRQEAVSGLFDSIPRHTFSSRPYREISNLFYFHSLRPVAEDNEFSNEPNIGLKLVSNNKLNTLDLYTGYQYNSGLQKSEYLTGLTYKRFFPVFDLSYINRARLSTVRQNTGGTVQSIPVSWREDFAEFRIGIPIIANRLNKTISTGINLSTSYTSRYDFSYTIPNVNRQIRFPVRYQVYFSHNSQRSIRDLAPNWGQNITISYESAPFRSAIGGELFSFRSSFYLPGFMSNHSIRARFNYQRVSGIYRFNVDIPRVSGYANIRSAPPLHNTLLLDYRLPLFYPDWELGPLAYVKRLKGGLFADFENAGRSGTPAPRTYGVELSSDLNILRFYIPQVEISARLVFLNQVPHKSVVQLGMNYGF